MASTKHLTSAGIAGVSVAALLVGLNSAKDTVPDQQTPTPPAAPLMSVDATAGQHLAASVHNPIFRQTSPDPSVLRVGRSYYMYATSNSPDDAMPVYRSEDLKNWRRVGQIFKRGRLLKWSKQAASGVYRFWGPDVRKIGSRYVAYYSTLDKQYKHDRFSIGVATALARRGRSATADESSQIPNSVSSIRTSSETRRAARSICCGKTR